MSYLEFEEERANSSDLNEVAHDEPPHQDLRCLQIQLFSSLVLQGLKQKFFVQTNVISLRVDAP